MSNYGGARKGAGRPPSDPLLKKIPVSYKLPRWLVSWMKKQGSSNAIIIEEAIVKHYKLTPPANLYKHPLK